MSTDSPTTECQRIRDAASDYLDGHITDRNRSVFDRHLDSCAACAEFVQSLQTTVGLLSDLREAVPSDSQEERAASSYDEYFPEPEVPEGLQDWTGVKRTWGELADLPLRERTLAIREQSKYLDANLCAWLIVRARRVASIDPSRAKPVAETAVEIARRRSEAFGELRQLVQALESLAWCLVVLREFAPAEVVLTELQSLVGSNCLASEERAMFFTTQGLYYSYTGRFEEGEASLVRSLNIRRQQGDRRDVICGLVNLAGAILSAGHSGRALALYLEAGGLLRSEEDPPRLQRVVCSSLVLALCEAGKATEARNMLPEVEGLAEVIGGWYSSVNVSWLKGTLYRAEGKYEESVTAFEEVRSEFLNRGHLVWSIEASLDLARVYLLQDRFLDLQDLASELLRRTEKLASAPRVQSAVVTFARAVRQQSLTAQLLSSIAIAISSAKLGEQLRD